LVWAAAGLAVYLLVQLGSDLATRLAPADRAVWAPLALGATLVVAGLYQFTPLKRVCLSHRIGSNERQRRAPFGDEERLSRYLPP
jgi:predicted metal-binding membrane protein